jgi:ribosomal protein S18 acetylase RimI-like enzyme
MVAQNGNDPVVILAGRLEKSEFAPKFGYVKPFRISARQLFLVHGGLIGNLNEQSAATLIECICKGLRQGEFDLVQFCHHHQESLLLKAAQRLPASTVLKDRAAAWSTHRAFSLPDSPGELLQKISSKHRSWIRRKQRDLDKNFAGRWEYRSFLGRFDLKEACQELEQVASLTYQRSLGAGFSNDPDSVDRLSAFHERGMLRAWTLRIDGTPRAYAIGICSDQTFHFSATGFDPKYRDHEIGTLLFLYMVDDLVKEGLSRFDFGLGDASYKQRFGDEEWKEATFHLYPVSAKGVIMKIITDSTAMLNEAGLKLGERLGVLQKIKTKWRKRLSRRESSSVSASGDVPNATTRPVKGLDLSQ